MAEAALVWKGYRDTKDLNRAAKGQTRVAPHERGSIFKGLWLRKRSRIKEVINGKVLYTYEVPHTYSYVSLSF